MMMMMMIIIIIIIHCSLRNFLTIQRILIISAFCVRLYRAMWKLSKFGVLCKLFGIVFVVHSKTGTIYTVFSCHVL